MRNSLPAVGWTRVDPATLQQGGTVNLAVSNSPTDDGNWNNNTAEGAEVYATQVEAPTYGTGITIKEDGSWEANPDYATSIELTSEDPQVVTVKLNDKAVWEDGSPMTAADYESTFHALSGQDPAYNIASSAGFDQVTSFDIASDYEFSFTVDPVYADWPNIMNADDPAEGDRRRPRRLEHRVRRQADSRRAARTSSPASTTRRTPSRPSRTRSGGATSRSWTRSPSR